MFKSQSKYKLFSYSILFEEIIGPFIDLISDFLSIDKENNWGIITTIDFSTINKPLAEKIENFKNSFLKFNKDLKERHNNNLTHELIERKEKLDNILQSLKIGGYSILSEYFFNEVFSSENLSKYGKSKIVLLDKINRYIITENDNISDIIIKILSKSQLVSKLITCTNKRENINFSKLTSFDNDNLYKSHINIEQLSILTCPVINLSYLKESFTKTPIESTDIWIYESFFEKYTLTDKYMSSKDIFILQSGDKILGINIGNICFIYESNPISLIKDEFLLDYYWGLLKNNIYRLPEQRNNFKSLIVNEFNEKVKEEDFTHLLSNLKKNLYIEDIEIPDKYKKYFEDSFKINELKHLAGYELYLPYVSCPESSLIGIYHTDKKPSETHYNLVHWISNHKETNKIYEFSKEEPTTKNKKKIHVLKPEISFYFRHKYFEVFFEEILKELKLQYVSNYKVGYKSNNKEAEFDFIIKTTRKIYVVELKTKLRNEEISKYEKKCKELIKEISPNHNNFEFLIIGALSDENCETYKYYIEEGEKKHPNYNIKRNDVFTIPYWFSFPIASSSKKLTCIAEPSFDRLKCIINEICV